jgi:hypothetical protein
MSWTLYRSDPLTSSTMATTSTSCGAASRTTQSTSSARPTVQLERQLQRDLRRAGWRSGRDARSRPVMGATDQAMRKHLEPGLLAFTVTRSMFELLCRGAGDPASSLHNHVPKRSSRRAGACSREMIERRPHWVRFSNAKRLASGQCATPTRLCHLPRVRVPRYSAALAPSTGSAPPRRYSSS